jgi:hypothetical protein
MLKSIITSYVNKCKDEELRREEIEAKIKKHQEATERHERAIQRLKGKEAKIDYISWIDEIIKPLGAELSKRLELPYEIYGPFGLRAATSIYLRKDMKRSICDQETWSITIIPSDLSTGLLKYETGEVKEGYSRNTMGDLNGFNNVLAYLPESIDDIVALLRVSGRSEEAV